MQLLSQILQSIDLKRWQDNQMDNNCRTFLHNALDAGLISRSIWRPCGWRGVSAIPGKCMRSFRCHNLFSSGKEHWFPHQWSWICWFSYYCVQVNTLSGLSRRWTTLQTRVRVRARIPLLPMNPISATFWPIVLCWRATMLIQIARKVTLNDLDSLVQSVCVAKALKDDSTWILLRLTN